MYRKNLKTLRRSSYGETKNWRISKGFCIISKKITSVFHKKTSRNAMEPQKVAQISSETMHRKISKGFCKLILKQNNFSFPGKKTNLGRD